MKLPTLFKFAGALVAALALHSAALADPISGNVNFLGAAQLDTTNLATATQVVSAMTFVGTADGDFSSLFFGQPVTFSSPWTFNSGAHAALWSVGGFTFDLSSSWIVTQDSTFLNVEGNGWITAADFDATPGTWSFTIPGAAANGIFTFAAATHAVPDGGTTALLLGAGLLTVAALRRRRVAA